MEKRDVTSLLGCTFSHLKKTLGEDFLSYRLRGRDVLVWDNGGGLPITCALEDGFVVSVDQQDEQRTEHRVVPAKKTAAVIHSGNKQFVCDVIDFSVKSVAVHMASDADLGKGDRVTCCSRLHIRAKMKAHVVLTGYVHSYNDETRRLVILFDSPFPTHSLRTLSDYINTRLAFNHLETPSATAALVGGEPENLGESDMVFVRSDLCGYCREVAQGLSTKERNHPDYGGCWL